MSNSRIEHINITVSNPEKSIDFLEKIFGWKVRWQGPSQEAGSTTHIGNDHQYLALWHAGSAEKASYQGLHHIGVVVDDLDGVKTKVEEYGFKPDFYSEYEPGRRFYFSDHDGIEYEVVSYAT